MKKRSADRAAQARRGAMRPAIAAALVASLLSGSVLAQPAPEPEPIDPTSGPTTGPTTGGPGTAPTGPGPGAGPSDPPITVVPIAAPPVPLTAEELEVLKDTEAEFDQYIAEGVEHHERMRTMMIRELESRTADLERKYAARIASTESDKNARHDETLALLEKFVADHPRHPQFTPDGMFRLADLYLDAADAQAELDAVDNPNALADYTKPVALWEDILTKFPAYRQTPATLYLLAYYTKTVDERRSMNLFLALTCANRFTWDGKPMPVPTRAEALARTESRTRRDPYADCEPMPGADAELVRHAWVRGLADYHFTVPGELDEAISSYLKVANGGDDSPLYPEALYKLAWSFYKRDFLKDSIKRFDDSVKYYDAIVTAGGQPQLELRDESIQYIAVAFTDPQEGETDSNPTRALAEAKAFYQGRESERHVRDVWVAMGNAFVELQAYDQAVEAYRIAIGAPWELDPKNPKVHQEIVNAFESKGDKAGADAAAAELAIRYAPGTAWYTANEKDREAMEDQRRIAERALYAATRNTHAAANDLRKEYEASTKKDPAVKTEYVALYNRAIGLYQTFIGQYPDSDYVYEFTFLMGEALYFSEQYVAAIEQYTWVRDHKELSEEYFLDAAKSILASYEAEAARQVAAGTLQALRVPTGDELKALPQPLTPQPIPEIYLKLQAEWDTYQNIVPDPKSAPTQGINAALVSLAYLHVDDAIARFEKVLAKFCGNPAAVTAKDGLLGIYDATRQLDKFEATNKQFINAKCGDAKSIELAQSQNRSIEFRRANELYADKRYVEAADAFYKYYKTAPAGDADLPISLYNSAVAYKLGERPKTAIAMFKEFTANKDKAFRNSPFYLDAVRLTAASYQAAFDYKNAIAQYLALYDLAKKAKAAGTKPPKPIGDEAPRTLDEIKLDALFNAAFAAELDRDFKQAITLYGTYEKEETNRRQQDRALWAVARIYKSSGDINSMEETFTRWRSRYGNDAGNENDYVASFYEAAAAWQRKGRASNADKSGLATIDAWRKKGARKGSTGAKMAGEWALEFADRYYNGTFEPYAIKKAAKTPAEITAQRKELEAVTSKAQDKYKELDDYGVAEYSMAAKVRFGETLQKFAQKLSEAPIPTPLVNADDARAAFEEQRDKTLAKFTNEAKTQWAEVVDLARKSGVSNKWTQLALENLSREFPGEFNVLHQELLQGTEAP